LTRKRKKKDGTKTAEKPKKEKIMKSKLLISFFILTVFFSCEKEGITYHNFKENIWDSSKIVKFDINFEDTTRLYSLDFSIRHNTSYSYQNIIFFTHHFFNNHKMSTDTLNIDLAQKDGEWYGSGKSDIRELSGVNYSVDKFYEKGVHTFELELAMRENNNLKIDNLPHISDISLYVTDINE
tara:strand:- start:239 stop:784 length:546 start_codon:yes stop_codon:yes gene_type:complete